MHVICKQKLSIWKHTTVYANSLLQKHSVRYELCFKIYLIALGNSASDGWSRAKRERAKSRERLLRTILFFQVTCKQGR